jgi:hypothetical protein
LIKKKLKKYVRSVLFFMDNNNKPNHPHGEAPKGKPQNPPEPPKKGYPPQPPKIDERKFA